MRVWLILSIIACPPSFSQQPEPDVHRMGPGVTPPKVLRKVEPAYSREGRDGHIQGTAVFEIVITERGDPSNITILSPLGFGLDEKGQDAIERWKFQPGTKNGKPVKIRATIEVNFRFAGLPFDAKTEQQRTDFNLALQSLQSSDEKTKARAVETIQNLSRRQFPPAMYMEGIWMKEGRVIPADPEQSLKLN